MTLPAAARGPVERVPVVVAGAGPVGLTVALALARAGVRSLVLERKRALDPHSRATLIVPRTLEILNALGVLPAFLAAGQRNDAIRILRAPDRTPLLTFDFAPLADQTPTPFALALAQDRTERILLAAVEATGLVEVAFDIAFARFEEPAARREDGEDGVRVHTATGRVVDAEVLVGADGAHSGVRRQLGWELEGTTYPTRAFLADVSVAPAADFTGGWLADPKAPSFTIAVRFGSADAGDGERHGVWRLIESAIPDAVTDADFNARARGVTETLFGAGAWRATHWTAAYRKHERRARRFVQGRVVLAGDAAHLNSPAGGQGMNAGLQDADRLARALAAPLAATRPGSEAPDAQALDAHLAAYDAERTAFFDDHVRALTDGIERMETAPGWLREVAFSAVRLVRAAGVEGLVARKLSMLDAGAGR